jgi:high-affinity nickel-transport protein
MELSGIILMFLLGLRHGFDPDHIAIIDGMSVRLSDSHKRLAQWTGTLFAIGHGSVVTTIAVMISFYSHSWNFSIDIWKILDWLPGLVLIIVGLMNLRILLKGNHYRPHGVKFMFIPKRLKNSSSPFAIVLIGILFAMVFDTNTQAAAWAYTASSKLSILSALALGLSFSAGMILTDTMDSRIMFLLMKRSLDQSSVFDYRRKLGWLIAILSLVVGFYKIISLLIPDLALAENVLTLIGIVFFTLMAAFYMYIYFSKPIQLNQQGNGN